MLRCVVPLEVQTRCYPSCSTIVVMSQASSTCAPCTFTVNGPGRVFYLANPNQNAFQLSPGFPALRCRIQPLFLCRALCDHCHTNPCHRRIHGLCVLLLTPLSQHHSRITYFWTFPLVEQILHHVELLYRDHVGM